MLLVLDLEMDRLCYLGWAAQDRKHLSFSVPAVPLVSIPVLMLKMSECDADVNTLHRTHRYC